MIARTYATQCESSMFADPGNANGAETDLRNSEITEVPRDGIVSFRNRLLFDA